MKQTRIIASPPPLVIFSSFLNDRRLPTLGHLMSGGFFMGYPIPRFDHIRYVRQRTVMTETGVDNCQIVKGAREHPGEVDKRTMVHNGGGGPGYTTRNTAHAMLDK
jgi:hypothetical protein